MQRAMYEPRSGHSLASGSTHSTPCLPSPTGPTGSGHQTCSCSGHGQKPMSQSKKSKGLKTEDNTMPKNVWPGTPSYPGRASASATHKWRNSHAIRVQESQSNVQPAATSCSGVKAGVVVHGGFPEEEERRRRSRGRQSACCCC
jgi:hypothetical protein